MARKREYPKTGWGREAEAEDIDAQVESERRVRGTHEYQSTYDEAKRRLASGESPDNIRAALTIEPRELGPLEDGRTPFTHKVSNAVERDMFRIRRDAIEDALADRPPSYKYA